MSGQMYTSYQNNQSKKNIQLVIVGYYKEYILANLDLIVNRQKQTVK